MCSSDSEYRFGLQSMVRWFHFPDFGSEPKSSSHRWFRDSTAGISPWRWGCRRSCRSRSWSQVCVGAWDPGFNSDKWTGMKSQE